MFLRKFLAIHILNLIGKNNILLELKLKSQKKKN
jgi:hypothetical protein